MSTTADNTTRAMVTATAVGIVFQVGMVLAGHANPAIARLFAVGGMGISFVAGGLYSIISLDTAWRSAMVRGSVAGGVCALVGICISFALGDVTAMILAVGTLSSAVTGAIGGSLGMVLSGSRAAAAADHAR